MSWQGHQMGGGCHHVRPERIDVVRCVDEGVVGAGDAEWILAAAMLDSLAEDLGLTHAAGWWSSEPWEMRGRCGEADMLLSEMESEMTQGLCDAVAAGTRGRVQIGTGWLVRQARRKAQIMKKNRSLSFVAVVGMLRQSLVRAIGNKRHEGMPPHRLPDGRFNPAYQRERVARLKAARKCRDCMGPLAAADLSRCAGCKEDHARRVKLSEQRRQAMQEVVA